MRNLPSISNNSSPSVVPSSEAIEEAIALTFSKVTVIEAGLERKVNTDDVDTPPDVLIVIGQGIPENVKEQLKYEVIRKGLNCHFIGDGEKNLSLEDIETYRKIFSMGDTQGLVFCHGCVHEGQHTVMLSDKDNVPTVALNHALRNKPSEFSTIDRGTRWDGMLNYFCCQQGKMRNQDTFQGFGKHDGLNLLHSSGKAASTDVQLINACAVLDYVGDCKANREELDPHQLMARVADVSGESLSLTGLPSGVPLLLRAPKNIFEATPDGMLAAIESPFRIRRNKLLSGDKADMKKFIDIRRAQTERSNQHMNTKLFSVLTTRLERGDTAAAIRILKYYPEIANGLPGHLLPARIALSMPHSPISLLQALREAGADFKIRDILREFTLIHIAVCTQNINSLKKILAFEPTLIDTPDKYGVTPLQFAVRYKNPAVIM